MKIPRSFSSRLLFRILPVVCALSAMPALSIAQTIAGKTFRIGILTPSAHELRNIRKYTLPELRKLGYVEGRNLAIDTRLGSLHDLNLMARELVALKPDAIITVGPPAVFAARRATVSIPILMGFMGQDPVAAGLADSLSRPGGNVTGTLILGQELEGKRLQLLHEALPGRKRFAVLLQPGNKLVEAAREAKALGIDLIVVAADTAANYAEAFAKMRSEKVEALLIAPSPAFFRDSDVLVKLTLASGLPTMCQWPEMAQAGCLLGYGPNYRQLRRQTAEFLVRIFKGESPANIPIQRPTQFEFVVNLKTAKALGITFPPSILLRADDVIE